MAEDGLKEWEMAPGDRRRGGPLHGEMAQGRGGEDLATPYSRGRQEQQPRETGGAGGGNSRTDTAVDECRNENGKACGKVQVRLTKWSVCYYSPEPSAASGSFCFVCFVEFNGGSAEATAVMTCCHPFFFPLLFFPSCLLPHFPLHRPYHALLRLMTVSSCSSSCCFCSCSNRYLLVLFRPCNSTHLRAVLSVQQQVVSVPLQHVRCSSCSLSFPFRSSRITLFRTPVVCFASFCFVFFVFFVFFSVFPFFSRCTRVWLVLLCSRTRYASTSIALP